mmetsp:Transcript_77851/g.134916  ORF Transcript_77851/g.134916 Transcript_77851/m.134916 type:complete len:345 (-) Transcript_77851:112-1146(-)
MMRLFTLSCFMLLGWSGLAGGQSVKDESESTMAASMMDGFDTNKDGRISFEELSSHVGDNAGFEGWQAGFKEADVDKDGQLTVKELESLLTHATKNEKDTLVDESEKSIAESVMDGFDTDKDGKLSLKELKEHVGDNKEVHAAFKGWEEGFKEADADSDAHLSTDELKHFFGHVGKNFQKHLASQSEQASARKIMKAFDADKNDKVSMAEMMEHLKGKSEVETFLKGWQNGFIEADADKDGSLNLEEMSSLLNHVQRDHRHKLVNEADATAASVMDGFDTDKDGKISLKELEEKISAKGTAAGSFKGWQTGFKEADADKDGFLTSEELAAWFKLISETPKHDEM